MILIAHSLQSPGLRLAGFTQVIVFFFIDISTVHLLNMLKGSDCSFLTEEQMVSNLTFKQENTIADEPVVDLLKFLTNKLDAAVVKARLPSGHNPLQQLVLIIADGRFHEKVCD